MIGLRYFKIKGSLLKPVGLRHGPYIPSISDLVVLPLGLFQVYLLQRQLSLSPGHLLLIRPVDQFGQFKPGAGYLTLRRSDILRKLRFKQLRQFCLLLIQIDFGLRYFKFQLFRSKLGQNCTGGHRLSRCHIDRIHNSANLEFHIHFGSGFDLAGRANGVDQCFQANRYDFDRGIFSQRDRFGWTPIPVTGKTKPSHH